MGSMPASRHTTPLPASGFVVGIDMGASNLRLALADRQGEILASVTETVRPEDGPTKMIARIKTGIRRVLSAGSNRARRASGKNPGALGALAIGVPSAVDPRSGLVALANNLPGWKNVDLARELEKEFRVPACIDNDANMAAIGEHWRGVARGVDHFVFIALGTGIGAGIFAEGRLLRGRTGNAGELYRMNVEWPRWAEDFGDLGYLEAHVSGIGIAAEGRRLLDSGRDHTRRNLSEQRDAQFVFEAFRRGDVRARAVLERTFTMLGVGVANLVAVVDPQLVVFGGGVVKGAPEFLLKTVKKVVRRIHPDTAPPLKLSALGNQAQTYGAIHSALRLAGGVAGRE